MCVASLEEFNMASLQNTQEYIHISPFNILLRSYIVIANGRIYFNYHLKYQLVLNTNLELGQIRLTRVLS